MCLNTYRTTHPICTIHYIIYTTYIAQWHSKRIEGYKNQNLIMPAKVIKSPSHPYRNKTSHDYKLLLASIVQAPYTLY
jgi:hypothetical protein